MLPRFNISRNYYNIVKDINWPDYDEFITLDLNSKKLLDLNPEIDVELLTYINSEPKYHKSLLPKLKTNFNGVEIIHEHFSQSWQDLFVLTALEGKRNGTYLEIGAGWPVLNNNTYLLRKFGYTGLSIDSNIFNVEEDWKSTRHDDQYIIADALSLDYLDLLSKNNFPDNIDYLQIDIDPDEANLELLFKIPFDCYKFATITFETDVFRGNQHVQAKSQEFLQDHGYILLIENVHVKNWETQTWEPFEDWYVHPELVNEKIIAALAQEGKMYKLPHDIFIEKL